MRYYLVKNGYLAGMGVCAQGDLPVLEGLEVHEGDPPDYLPKFPEPAPTYSELRRKAYPYIGDQLDALWKGGAALVAMQAEIAAVKARYPKTDA